MAVSLAAIGAVGHSVLGVLVLVAVWGFAVQLIMPIVTFQAVEAGGGIAAALNPGAANVGIAGGGLIAGVALGVTDLENLPWIASGATVLMVLVIVTCHLVDVSMRSELSPTGQRRLSP